MLSSTAASTYHVGPLFVSLRSSDDLFHHIGQNVLGRFSRPWNESHRTLRIDIVRAERVYRHRGAHFRSARLSVDRVDALVVATTASAISARGEILQHEDRWNVAVPARLEFSRECARDVEELLDFVCRSSWRRTGWEPLRAAACVDNDRCVMIAAPHDDARAGLARAFLGEGWKSLGDDTVLVRTDNDAVRAASVMRTFTVRGRHVRWIGESGDGKPRYAAWTPKRRIHLADLQRWTAADAARPTAVLDVQLMEQLPVTHRLLPLTAQQCREVFERIAERPAESSDDDVDDCLTRLSQQVSGFRAEVAQHGFDAAALVRAFVERTAE